MKIIAFLAALVVLSSPAHAQMFGGTGDRSYIVRNFSEIRVDGGLRVDVETGKAPSAIATGERDDLDNLIVRVNGDTLVIRQRSPSRTLRRGERQGPVSVRVTVRNLEKAWLTGSGSLTIDRVDTPEFGLAVQGSGLVRIDSLEVTDLELLLNGTASAQIGGAAETGTIVVRGVSSLRGYDLSVEQLELAVDGPGYVEMGPSETVKLEAIGVGEINLAGSPSCLLNLSGAPMVAGCGSSNQR